MNRPPANLAQLAPNELQALESMRLLFKNEPYPDQQDPNSWFQLEDWTYLRYLRARKFDVPKAELMLKNTLEMRRKYSPHLMSENDPVMRKILIKSRGFAPPTKQHLAVQFTEAGKLDLSLIETDDEFYRYLVLLSELSIRDLHHRSGPRSTGAAVVDFQHFSLIKSSTPKAIRFSKMLVSVGEMHFPEMLGRVVMFQRSLYLPRDVQAHQATHG
ncbi:hypothetical protein BASA81_010567 [Batrachochytrium salamandrivorans]|nr:hypothetical protein BASA81_010567 [Batrachochytrium salamandrivorans]